MSTSPRDSNEALAFARHQHRLGHTQYGGMCQAFVHDAYGIGPMYGSAYEQWLNCPPHYRFPGGHPYGAPVGSALCFKGGSRGFGHIMLAAKPFANGRHAAWSNDLVTFGHIDKVLRNAPVTHWGQEYLGYITNVNGVPLRLV